MQPKEKPIGRVLKVVTRPVGVVTRDSKHILTEHYKAQMRDVMHHGADNREARRYAGNKVENWALKGQKRMIDAAMKGVKKGAGKGVELATRPARYKFKSLQQYRKAKARAARTPIPQHRRKMQVRRLPSPREQARRRMQMKKFSQIKERQRLAVKERGWITADSSGGRYQTASTSRGQPASAHQGAQNLPKEKLRAAQQAPKQRPQAAKNMPKQRPRADRVAQPPAPSRGPHSPPAAGTTNRAQQAARSVRGGAGKVKAAPRFKLKSPKPTKTVKQKTAAQAAKTGNRLQRFVAQQMKRQAVRKAQQKAAKQTASKTVKAVKMTVKFILRAVRRIIVAAVQFVKTVSAIFAFAGFIIPIIVIVGVVAAIIASPFGLLMSGSDTGDDIQPIGQVVAQTNAEFDARIDSIKQSYKWVDSIVVHYEGSADGAKINNWIDVLTIFAVGTTMRDDGEAMDVVTIDTTRVGLIKAVFWDMNTIETEVESIHHPAKGDDDSWTEYILHITVTSKTAEQQAAELGYTEDMRDVLAELMSGEYDVYFYLLLGLEYGGGSLTDEELAELIKDLPEGEHGSTAVRIALTRLGDPYSIPKAGTGRYTDCSHLVQWSYAQLGVTLPRNAAQQAQWCANNGRVISKDDLQPGDLVFWSYEANGRYRNISHVGIYAGNGNVVHASSVDMQVVIEPLFHAGKQVMYGRPS